MVRASPCSWSLPFARSNFVDHRVTDQSSVIRFVEDNWKLDRIGNGSADAIAGTLDGLFDFSEHGGNRRVFLDPLDRPAHRLSSTSSSYEPVA